MTVTTTEHETRTIDVPGAVLTYDVRRNEASVHPPLFLVGLPMGAAGFGTLAGHFADRTVMTYDPRGSERSIKTDPTSEADPSVHADDLHRLIQALGEGPVDVFGSSGGAITSLALASAHPESVRTVVAHEPPLTSVLPDADNARAATRAVHDTYQAKGFGAGMAHFIAIVSHQGEYPDDIAQQPAPDPAMFGMPAADDGSRTDPLLGSNNMITTTHHQPDFDALRASPARIVIAAGAGSAGIMSSRAAYAVAERLGTEVVVFPGDHGGFMGGEYGQTGEPEAFAAKLRQVLDGA